MKRLGAGNRSILWQGHLDWFYRSDYFNELVVPQRAFDAMWAAVPVGTTRVPAVLHGYHDRRFGGRRFGAVEVQLMRLIRPALAAGVQAVVRMHEHRTALAVALDALSVGVLVYAVDGRLLHRNSAFGTLAETRQDEEALMTAARGMVRSHRSRSIADRFESTAVSQTVRTNTGRYVLNAVRIGEGMFASQPCLIVLVSPDAPSLPDWKTLCERFGLTPRQVEVALLLARRRSNREIADTLGISAHTAKRHTEQVFMKLDVSSRAQVASKLMNGGSGRPE